MGQPAYIPQTPHLRAQQVESWAHQAGAWGHAKQDPGINSHHSANTILEAVEPNEKAAIKAAWAKGYRNGQLTR